MDNIKDFYREVYKIKEDMKLISSNLVYQVRVKQVPVSQNMCLEHTGYFFHIDPG